MSFDPPLPITPRRPYWIIATVSFRNLSSSLHKVARIRLLSAPVFEIRSRMLLYLRFAWSCNYIKCFVYETTRPLCSGFIICLLLAWYCISIPLFSFWSIFGFLARSPFLNSRIQVPPIRHDCFFNSEIIAVTVAMSILPSNFPLLSAICNTNHPNS